MKWASALLESFKWPLKIRLNSHIVWWEWFSSPPWPCILQSYSADLHLCFRLFTVLRWDWMLWAWRKLLSPTHTDVLILPVLNCLFNPHLNDFMGSYVTLDLGSLFYLSGKTPKHLQPFSMHTLINWPVSKIQKTSDSW